MSRSVVAEDTLSIRILPTAHPDQYQVSIEAPVPLFGGPVIRPERLIGTEAIRPIRRAYEQQVVLFHELEVSGVRTPAVDLQPLMQIGRDVAKLLPRHAHQGMVLAVRHAQRRKRRLRIMLEVTVETRLFLAVPWELLVLPLRGGAQLGQEGEEFLLYDASVNLVRQVRGAGQQRSPQVTQPLTVQAFLATPIDGRPIESATTYEALTQLLTPTLVASSWFTGPGTLAAIAKRLRASDPQILHLLCHGEERVTRYGSRHDLIVTHLDGFMQRVSAFELAPLLSLAPNLQLVLLQACHSGSMVAGVDDQGEGERRTLESIALALVRQGVPAVVAMQGEVGQVAAGAFVESFYHALADEGSLDRAVAAGRAAMRSVGGAVDWSIPVVYQGSGRAEMATWYNRASDWVETALHQPVLARTVRATFLAWALILFAAGLARWLLVPSDTLADLTQLSEPLAVWVGVGLVGPAIIATAQSGVREREDLPPAVRRAIRYAQWGGAYLGYTLAGLCGLMIWVSLWALGLLALIPAPLPLLLFVVMLLGALAFSYVIARSQWRSALAIAPVDDSIYTRSTLLVILIAAATLLVTPLGIVALPGSPFAWLLYPSPAAMALAGVMVTLVFGVR